jgi:hypothetical protein
MSALVETLEGELKIIEWRNRIAAPLHLGPTILEDDVSLEAVL